MKQVVILAGGKGTRLRERLGDLPKPLVDICGTPLLERQILLVKRYSFTDALILVNHAADYILDYCASKNNWGLKISCIDDGEPRGTAGATLAVFDQLAEEFLLMYGDTMLEVDLARFYAYHRQANGVAATIFLHPNDHPQDSDLVELDESGIVTGFYPYPHSSARYFPNLVNAALYWVSKQALAPWSGEPGMLDFGKDIFPAMLKEGLVLRGYNSPEYIKDIGTPARLDKVCLDFQSGKIERASLDRPQPIVFLDRDGTINREVDHLKTTEQFELLPGVEHAVKLLNRSEYRTCVVTNQPVIARGECSETKLREIHNKMETLLGQGGAFVDRIYYCPHHPDSGYSGERVELKVACACRKPNIGMIENALADFNGARERSWMVGDSSVDIETAKRAGLKSILVETGYAGLDCREWAIPDAIVPDLASAVEFILDQYPRVLAHCAQLAENIRPGSMVLIGGHARCGKSTFANVLRDAIQADGRRVWVLSADRWLRSEHEREEGVWGRYDMATLQSLADELGNKERQSKTIRLPGYNKLKRIRVEGVEQISVSSSDIILIEGTIALALRTSPDIPACRFHVQTDEASRLERVLNEYRLRGRTDAEALEIYQRRRADEFPVIEDLAQGAQTISLTEILA